MSTASIECSIHIEGVDVDERKENGSNSVLSCDSGVETLESTSGAYPPSSDSDISPERDIEIPMDPNISGTEDPDPDSVSELSAKGDDYSDDKKDVQNAILADLLDSKDISGATSEIISSDKGNSFNNYSHDIKDVENLLADLLDSKDISESTSDISNNSLTKSIPKKSLYNNSDQALHTSTISLTDHTVHENKISNSFSRSVENVSISQNHITNDEGSSNSSANELDKERILSEYTSQKTKACATQKIVPENSQVLDVRYSRLPKDILSQDLGSIVKNVHGIFSSVSGTLKNAYNNSHRVSQKPQIKTVKPIANGKIMSDIFEDASDEKLNEAVDRTPIEINTNPTIELEPSINHPVEESDPKNEMLKLQIESLERVLFEQRKENSSLRERVKQQVDELSAKDQTFKDLEVKVDLMCKRAELAQKEKDAAVMRYASTECAAIEAKKAAETAAKAERAAIAERELLNTKLRTAREEKQRICQLYDDKCHELQNSEREIAKVREEFKDVEGRLKWTQSKLRMEMDASKENTERIEKLSQQVTELEAAREAAVTNATDTLRAKQLDTELKESQAAQILCRHEKEETERRLAVSLQQLDTCRRERDDATASLADANKQVESLKISNIRLEEEAAELAALRAQAALADTLSAQLQRETERACLAEQALSAERARAETCSRREAGALEHAARLTAQHVASRASANEHEAKAQALAADNSSLREKIEELERENERLKATVEGETERRYKENRVLARKVAELTEECAEANKKLEWELGENSVLKKKHASAVKELNRELQRALKRIEQLESKLPQNDATSIRTGSVSSLTSSETPPQEDRITNGHADPVPDVQAREPDRAALVERIVSLQRAAAARAERCEFLQEHCAQLTRELRGKGRLLRALLPALPPAALASSGADEHKKEIARLGGGAMAAVWGGDPGGMTLELSLEMNRRLQAVLEDTLLKNITLKENMDTLGEEISRLREQQKNEEKN